MTAPTCIKCGMYIPIGGKKDICDKCESEEPMCDCKYNEQCESTRQYVQQLIRDSEPTKTVENCDFYGYIEEKSKEK